MMAPLTVFPRLPVPKHAVLGLCSAEPPGVLLWDAGRQVLAVLPPGREGLGCHSVGSPRLLPSELVPRARESNAPLFPRPKMSPP